MAGRYGKWYAVWGDDGHGRDGSMGVQRTIFDAGHVDNHDGWNDAAQCYTDDIDPCPCSDQEKYRQIRQVIICNLYFRLSARVGAFQRCSNASTGRT